MMRACAILGGVAQRNCKKIPSGKMERTTLLLLVLELLLSVEGRGGGRDDSPYDVLGVSRDASQKEIRSAYKRLAREWHPDKNKSPQAQEKILEINKAYEVLSAEESRRRYDMTGETDPAPSGSHSHAHNQGFTFFQADNGFFHFGGFGHSHHRDDTITGHYFQNVVLSESGRRLWLLYFFGDFCMQCGEVSRIWDELKEEMQLNGVGMASVHDSRQYGIVSHCNVDRIPAVVAVVNRRVFHYHGLFQTRSIRSFVKSTLPSWVITDLTAESVERFTADSIARNRPRLILFSPHPQPSLLYKAVAFSNRPVADFGFVTTDKLSGKSLAVLQRYSVSRRTKKLLVFKEYPLPSTTLEGSEVTGKALRSILDGLSLHLPRLTSPHVLKNTCGSNGRLCLILIVRGADAYNDSVTRAFRAQGVQVLTSQKVPSVAYIDEETQQQFIGSFPRIEGRKMECKNGKEARDVLLLRRKMGFHSSYDWFSGYCGSREDFDKLLSFAGKTGLKTATKPAPNLLDEFAPGLLSRMWSGFAEKCYQLYDFSTANSQLLSLLTMTGVMAATLCCASVIGASQMPEEQKRRHRARRMHKASGSPQPAVIPEFSDQLYQRHIEEAQRGSVVILTLLDSATEDKLVISNVAKRHKRQQINFFWAELAVGYSWLQELLEASSMDPEEVEMRERLFCSEDKLGRMCTLALFGTKKQFAIFPELVTNISESESFYNGLSTTVSETKRELEGNGGVMDTVMGSFGFEDVDHGEEREEEGLRVWMERLEDGTLKRYSVDSWPSWK